MGTFRVYAHEALEELRAGLRSSLVPLMFVGLSGYVFLMLCNAQFLRDMGGADVPRNSSLIVFQMTAGQAFWLIFVWAWVFAQVVTRDRQATLHEVVLCAPVSLQGLILARFAGALVLACILGSSSSIGLLLVPVLAALGAFPVEAVGPVPLAAVCWAWLLFVLPSALGLGALYTCAALRTRSSAGSFALAAVVVFLWMAAMVVLRSGDMASSVATLMDVSGFGEAEHQTKLWTPALKARGLMALTQPLLWNRVLWTVLPGALFAGVLLRLDRRSLVLERAQPQRTAEVTVRSKVKQSTLPLSPITEPAWWHSLLLDALWQLKRTVSRWAFVLSLLLWTTVNVGGPFVHLLGHAEGPIEPRPQVVAPFLVQLCYVFSVFLVAGFVGTVVRRDAQSGLGEMIDATPSPVGVRVLASALCAAVVTVVLALTPTLSAYIVVALALPHSFQMWDPLAVNALVAAPALLELCGMTFVIHALVRSAGTAHALSMFAAFVAIVNNEVGIVSYPPGKLGVPGHIALSEIAGFRPWLGALLTLDTFKLALVLLLVALAWAVYPRGTALTLGIRARSTAQRLLGGAGIMALLSAALLGYCGYVLHTRLAVRGDYRPQIVRQQRDAQWETRVAGRAGAFALAAAEIQSALDPQTRTAHTRVQLHGVRAPAGALLGTTPHGMDVLAARVGAASVSVRSELDAFEVPLGACADTGCEVSLDIEIRADGWNLDAAPPWLDSSGVWARAADLVPRLGVDVDRRLRSPQLRQQFGLPAQPIAIAPQASVPASGVMPAGHYRWEVTGLGAGSHTALSGEIDGVLDFALVWLPEGRAIQALDGDLTVWHGATRAQLARDVRDDLRQMQDCVSRHLGRAVPVETLLQAPRGLGDVALHGRVLWMAEEDGWDSAAQGVGRTKRRAAIAHALAASTLAQAADLRTQPGSRWLTEGLAGSVALSCVRERDGLDAFIAWMGRGSDHVAEQLGALDAPIVSLAEDGPAKWVAHYAPLSTLAWAQGRADAQVSARVQQVLDEIRAGRSVRKALARAVGEPDAQLLLGTPFASDMSVQHHADTPDTLEIRGERARWSHGDWEPVSNSLIAIQRFEDDDTPQQLNLPAQLPAARHFTVFDALPSYERSPDDNTWR